MFSILNYSLRIIFVFYTMIVLCYNLSSGLSVGDFFSSIRSNVLFYSVSPLIEMCDQRWVHQDLRNLEEDLESFVFGQHLATEVVLIALQSHLRKTHRQKPLVLNFHGWTGGGKGYVANFILKNFFKKAEASKFVRKYLARIHFPLDSEVPNYQKQLQNDLEQTISRCSKAVFVFDEVDKYPPKLLDGIKPYLDYSSNINGYDFREAIFIFITNNGQSQITDIALEKFKNGVQREELQLRDFERVLKTTSFNNDGGFFQSDLIKHHLIDYVIPFLPLEKKHVEKCIEVEMSKREMNFNHLSDVVSEIMEDMVFGPEGSNLYSAKGCKNIGEKVDYIKERERIRKRRKHIDL